MATTIELIDWLEKQELAIRGACASGTTNQWADKTKEVAQRLRELDKPDCVWTQKEAFALWKYYHPSCILMADSSALPTKKNRYCQYCGGAVKDAT